MEVLPRIEAELVFLGSGRACLVAGKRQRLDHGGAEDCLGCRAEGHADTVRYVGAQALCEGLRDSSVAGAHSQNLTP